MLVSDSSHRLGKSRCFKKRSLNFKRLDKCEFIRLLKVEVRETMVNQSCGQLEAAHDRFLIRIKRITGSCISPIEKLPQFNRTMTVLSWLKANIKDRSLICHYYVQSAISALKFEKQAVLLQIEYPGLNEFSFPKRNPPFQLSPQYTPTDLMECIVIFHAMHFFNTPNYVPPSLKQLTQEFEHFCGVHIKNPDNARWAILHRSNLTRFVDMMRNTLIALSQE